MGLFTLDKEPEVSPAPPAIPGATVDDLVTEPPRVVYGSTALTEVKRLLRAELSGALPVIDLDRVLVGIVTEHDLVLRAYSEEKPITALLARDVMTTHPHSVRLDDSIETLIRRMDRYGLRWVPVADEQRRVVGLVSLGDIAQRADGDPGLRGVLAHVASHRSFWDRLWQ